MNCSLVSIVGAHSRAVLSATITRADTANRITWHHAVQHPLRTAGAIGPATNSSLIMVVRRRGHQNPSVTLLTSFILGGYSFLPSKISDVILLELKPQRTARDPTVSEETPQDREGDNVSNLASCTDTCLLEIGAQNMKM